MSMLKMPSGSRLKLRSSFVYEKTTNENIVHKAWCCCVKVQAERGIRSVGKSERFDSTAEVGEPYALWGVEGGKRIVEILNRYWETYKCLDI